MLVWFGGLNFPQGRGRILEPLRYKRELSSRASSQVCLNRGSKLIEMIQQSLNFPTGTGEVIAPHYPTPPDPKQRSREPHVPQASTRVTHSFLEMLWSVPELERAPNMPHRRHGLRFSVYDGVYGI